MHEAFVSNSPKVRIRARALHCKTPPLGVDTVILGTNPRPRSGQAFKLNKDSSITDASHVHFELDATKKGFCSVIVTDLKVTYLDGKEIGQGKKQTAFCNDLIVMGASTFSNYASPLNCICIRRLCTLYSLLLVVGHAIEGNLITHQEA